MTTLVIPTHPEVYMSLLAYRYGMVHVVSRVWLFVRNGEWLLTDNPTHLPSGTPYAIVGKDDTDAGLYDLATRLIADVR